MTLKPGDEITVIFPSWPDDPLQATVLLPPDSHGWFMYQRKGENGATGSAHADVRDEGITWMRGHDPANVAALRAAYNLAPDTGFPNGALYTSAAATMFHTHPGAVTTVQRQTAKRAINGYAYGATPERLAAQLEVPLSDIKAGLSTPGTQAVRISKRWKRP